MKKYCRDHQWTLLILLMVVACSPDRSYAQQLRFTFEQAFRGSPNAATRSLPAVKGWQDDEHYLESRKDEKSGISKLYSVEVLTGKAIEYAEPVTEDNNALLRTVNTKDRRNVSLSPDKKWAAYTKADNNLYLLNTGTNAETPLTTDGSETILNGYASWVYYEEILGRGSRYKAFWWSPDSKKIAFMRFDDSQVPVFPIYWSDGQHGKLENQRYPKSGDKNPEVRIGIAAIDNPRDKIIWADFNPAYDQYFGTPIWTPRNQLWVPWMNRGQDSLTLYDIDLANGKRKTVYAESQKTWIDLDDLNRVEFLSDGSRFLLKSDKEGWESLTLHDAAGQLINPVVTGICWGMSIVRIDEKNKQLYFRARRENSARFDFYRVGLDGKGMTRLSFGEFSHDQVLLSPNARYFITTYSNVTTPTTMAIADMKGNIIRELGNVKGQEFDNFSIPRTEIVKVRSEDGLFDLPVSITYPVDFDPKKKYPVLVSIYGGPNAGTVFDRWKNVGGPTQWWAQEGMIQVAFDNRSSGHFGKQGLNYIHRQLGKYEIEDYMSCGRWLRRQAWVDTTKLAITGGSFGGYMTCMALTYGADVFTHGIANASVTDWLLYDTHYTERFMDTPDENPEGYKKTSVMQYTDRYKGLLRIVHGTSDDNVHMQNSIQLVNKLQENGKQFQFMLYPGERHGIGAGSGNKAQHIRNVTYKFYYETLLQKPMPETFWGSGPARRGF